MKKTWLVTGATGHLGNSVTRYLIERGQTVRALVMPGDPLARFLPAEVEPVCGNVCDKESLRVAFAHAGRHTTVVHCAGIVSIGGSSEARLRAVNVDGTRNILNMCSESGVGRMVFVSSVHALPVLPDGVTMKEISKFSPHEVVGGYARTKAEATEAVLEYARQGLDASVVQPSGLIGPNDYGCGHTTNLLLQIAHRRLPASIAGGYDFVDVRDVAAGIVACADAGRRGECYILGGGYVESAELMRLIARAAGVRPPRYTVPLWAAELAAPLAELLYRMAKAVPLYTRYALYTLSSNALFSSAKARDELDFQTRPLAETISDTLVWLQAQGRLSRPAGELSR